MSDDFVPLNQSTPVQNRWQRTNQRENSSHRNKFYQKNINHRSYNHNNRWGNKSQQNNSFGSDNNRSNSYNSSNGHNSSHENRNNIDAYLHPSMLQDPWENMRQKTQNQL